MYIRGRLSAVREITSDPEFCLETALLFNATRNSGKRPTIIVGLTFWSRSLLGEAQLY